MSGIIKQSFEEKVEEDFLFFLEHFKETFDGLKSECEKEICKKWLDKLAIDTYETTNEKQTRNIYLSQLILSMNERKLNAPFNTSPNEDPLSLNGVFKHITTKPSAELEKEKEIKETKQKWKQFVRNRELEMIELNHTSNDGRTYLACKTLPENLGLFAYIAVTLGSGRTDSGWVNACGQPIPAPEVKPLDLKVDTPEVLKSEKDDKAFQMTAEVRAILSQRKSPEARKLTYDFFKRVYSSVEQEMLSEQNCHSTACRDPYVQKLLEKLTSDIKACDKFNPVLCKRIKMLSMLKKRVTNILNDIDERNDKLDEIKITTTSAMMTLVTPAAHCHNSMSQMMWQGALMEKPTSKIADALEKAYPVCMVKMLLTLLVRERQKIVGQLKEKQEKILSAMKKDVQNEIRRGIEEYKIARREWVTVLRIVMQYNKLKGTLNQNDLGEDTENTKGDYLQDTIRKEIEDNRIRLDKANKKNEKLQDNICELTKSLHELTEKIEFEQVKSTDQLRDLQIEICSEKSSIVKRTQTLEGLERMLKELQK